MKKLFVFLFLFNISNLQSSEVKLIKVFEGLNKPWSLSFINENNILVTEKPGNLLFINLKDKTKSIVFVSIGAVALAVVIFLAKRKK